MLRSLRSPAFEEQIRAIKEGRIGPSDIPKGWSYKWVKTKSYEVYQGEECVGAVSRVENIPGYIERLIKSRSRHVRVRKISGREYALYVEGKLLFMGHSPKHCWNWLLERNAAS